MAVVLDDERAADAFRKLERRAAGESAHGGAVEQLAGSRQEAGREDLLHRERGRVLVGEKGQQRGHAARQGDELQGRLDDDRQRPFAADEKLGEVIAGHPLPAAVPALDQLAGGQDGVHSEDIVARHAVLERARAARVVREVAADGAHRLRVRIGGIEEALRLDRLLQLLEDHSGLDHRNHVGARDLEDAVHLLQREDDAAPLRQGPAALPRAGAARNDRDALLASEAQDLLHLARVARQHCRLGRIGSAAAFVALVRRDIARYK